MGHLHTLQDKNEQLIRAQQDLYEEILSLTIEPGKTVFLLHQLCTNAQFICDNERYIKVEIERTRRTWIQRFFGQ